MPVVTVEKIADSEPIPFKPGAKMPLDGIRALAHGACDRGSGNAGRDLAFYGADVLNIWRPNSTEMESFFWDTQVGMRSTILDSSGRRSRRSSTSYSKKMPTFSSCRQTPRILENPRPRCRRELGAKKPGLDPRNKVRSSSEVAAMVDLVRA